jgi:hypothetical protein
MSNRERTLACPLLEPPVRFNVTALILDPFEAGVLCLEAAASELQLLVQQTPQDTAGLDENARAVEDAMQQKFGPRPSGKTFAEVSGADSYQQETRALLTEVRSCLADCGQVRSALIAIRDKLDDFSFDEDSLRPYFALVQSRQQQYLELDDRAVPDSRLLGHMISDTPLEKALQYVSGATSWFASAWDFVQSAQFHSGAARELEKMRQLALASSGTYNRVALLLAQWEASDA